MSNKLETRKKELAEMTIDDLCRLQAAHGLPDYKGMAEAIRYPIKKRSLRELMTLDIIRHERHEILFACNAGKPPLYVKHSELESESGSLFRKTCPACKMGILLVQRDRESFLIQAVDNCTLCLQLFVYDIADLKTSTLEGSVSEEIKGMPSPSDLLALAKSYNDAASKLKAV